MSAAVREGRTRTDADLLAVARSCSQHVGGPGPDRLAAMAQVLAEESARGGDADRYGAGGVVAEVEQQVGDLLGQTAVLMPTGTMATQVALSFWARTSRRVAMHATAHPLLHEDDALPVVQGLAPVVLGDRPSLERLEQEHAKAPIGALLVEVVQRETGGQVIGFDELTDLAAWCGQHEVALHLDGARLWECASAYAPHALADVVALAGSAYVSLYKGIGAPAGAVLLGPDDLLVQARLARHRLGGALFGLWPLALGARRGLREDLPQLAACVGHAQRLAALLAEVVCRPETNLFHLVLPGEPDAAQDALVDVSQAQDLWLGRAQPGPRPGTSKVELSVLPAGLRVPPERAAAAYAEVAALLRTPALRQS